MNFLIGVAALLIVPLIVGKIARNKSSVDPHDSDVLTDWLMGLIICIVIGALGFILLKASGAAGGLIVR